MKENKNVPEIRFKGFEGEWEELTLGDMGQITMGQSPSSVNYTTDSKYHILVQGNSDMKNGKVTPRVWTKQVTKTADSGDLIISVRAPVGDVGKTSYNVVIGRGVAAIKANEFVFQSLIKKKEFGYWDQFSTGSTFESINSNVLKKAIISTTSQKEQSQIGTFFQNLDQQITLEQQKHDKLVTLKKAMLEKMFPKEGASVPEIRFKGFEGEWEFLKLSDISDIVGGGTPSTAISEYWNGDIDWYSPTEIGDCAYVGGSVKKITQLGLDNSSAKILPKDKTILFTSRAGIGDMAILKKNGATNQGFQSFVLKNGIEPYFILSAGHLIKEFALKHSSGSTFLEVSGKTLGEMKLLIPSQKEQSQIGTFFQNLDKLISLQQQKIDKLKNIKKACLDKMFV